MKSNKSSLIKRETKPAAPTKMRSALTNLDQLVQAPPKLEVTPASVKPEQKPRLPKPASLEKPPSKPVLTSIQAKVDIGYGNTLFIRGQGAGLSWEKGIPLSCEGASSWLWTGENVTKPLEFKLLLNDEIWSAGENVVVAPGQAVEVKPVF